MNLIFITMNCFQLDLTVQDEIVVISTLEDEYFARGDCPLEGDSLVKKAVPNAAGRPGCSSHSGFPEWSKVR